MALKGAIDTSYKGDLEGVRYFFAGLNNVLDPYNLPIEKGWVSKAENVYIDNTNSISRRDGYSSVITTTGAHSGWSDDTTAFYVDGVYLKQYDGATAKTIDVVTPNLRMYYVSVNNIIIYSNGTEYGIIGEDSTQTKTYSAEFKELTEFGTHLEFYNGRVYHAKDNSLFCTDVFDVEHSDVRQKNVATFKSKITMVRRVEDGLYIGTESNLFFLKGNDPVEGGFEQNILANYGIVSGSDVSTTGEYCPDAKAQGEVIICSSKRGICTCGANGNFINQSVNIVSLPESNSGSAMMVDNGGFRCYVSTLFDSSVPYNKYPDATFDVNTD